MVLNGLLVVMAPAADASIDRCADSAATIADYYTRDPELNFGGQYYPIDGGNNYYAQGDGAQGWNVYRSDGCAVPPTPLNGRHWSQVELLPQGVRNPFVTTDNYNLFGYVNFTNPPAGGNTTCRNNAITNSARWVSSTCWYWATGGDGIRYTQDWGIAVNVNGLFPISTNMQKANMYYLQTLSTHEFGHAYGLAHPSSPSCSTTGWNTNDAHAELTMYACSSPGPVSFAHYSLGSGDMWSAEAKG